MDNYSPPVSHWTRCLERDYTGWKPHLSYSEPVKCAINFDNRPPRLHASHDGTAKSRAVSVKSGYFSKLFLNSGFHTEDDTIESIKPDIFLRVTCKGTEKYSSPVRDHLQTGTLRALKLAYFLADFA